MRMISTTAGLDALCRGYAEELSLQLDLDEFERARWEARLNRYASACGCSEAAAGLVIGLLVVVAWLLWVPFGDVTSRVLIAVSIVIGLLLLGKFLGLHYARIRFRRTCRALLRRLRDTNELQGEI